MRGARHSDFGGEGSGVRHEAELGSWRTAKLDVSRKPPKLFDLGLLEPG